LDAIHYAVINQNGTDYISLTDMTVSSREGCGLIGKGITNKNTLEFAHKDIAFHFAIWLSPEFQIYLVD